MEGGGAISSKLSNDNLSKNCWPDIKHKGDISKLILRCVLFDQKETEDINPSSRATKRLETCQISYEASVGIFLKTEQSGNRIQLCVSLTKKENKQIATNTEFRNNLH